MTTRDLTRRFVFLREEAKLGLRSSTGPMSRAGLQQFRTKGMKFGRYLVSAAKSSMTTLPMKQSPTVRRMDGSLYTRTSTSCMEEHRQSHDGDNGIEEDIVLSDAVRRGEVLRAAVSLRGVRGAGESEEETEELAVDSRVPDAVSVASTGTNGMRRRGTGVRHGQMAANGNDSANVSVEVDSSAIGGVHYYADESEDEKRQSQQTPEWVSLLSRIDLNLDDVAGQLSLLQKKQVDALRVRFDDSEQVTANRSLDLIRREINNLLRDSQKCLIRIGSAEPGESAEKRKAGGSSLSADDKSLRLNAMRSRAVRMRALTKRYRNDERGFVEKLSKQTDSVSSYFRESQGADLSLQRVAEGMSQQQLAQMQRMEQTTSERSKAIVKVAQSVSQINAMYKEMAVFVLDAGSVLDRIDYNVECSLENIKGSQKHIVKTETYQKKSQKTIIYVIMLLFAAIVICLCILVLKVSMR